MKKKIISFCLLLFIVSCAKEDITEIEQPFPSSIDIFEVQSTVVKDGQRFNINLSKGGTYKLSLVDEFTNITHTNEIFVGNIGTNVLSIYTRALPKGSYNLIIKDVNDNPIKQTSIKL